MELPEMTERSYTEFAEEKFLELITEAHRFGLVDIGQSNVIKKMESGTLGLVFLAGESRFTRNIAVCLLCIDRGIFYHVFDSGKHFRDIVKANCSVVMVRSHCSYKGLYDLCKTAIEIINDH